MRMGITSAFEVKDESQQSLLAQEQIKEVIRAQLAQAIADYESRYDDVLGAIEKHFHSTKPRDFIISYQTLLSPFVMETLIYSIAGKAIHREGNNARFVEMAKAAVKDVAREFKDKNYQSASGSGKEYKLIFTHTNSSINRLASTMPRLLRKFESSGKKKRDIKFAATFEVLSKTLEVMQKGIKTKEMMGHDIKPDSALNIGYIIKYIGTGVNELGNKDVNTVIKEYEKAMAQYLDDKQKTNNNPENQKTASELAMRMRASYYLRRCLDKESPYNEMSKYQRNIMIAALENIMLGKQGLKLAGCKSARDRTAVFAAAVKGMLTDPKAMTDWKILEPYIQDNLRKGHHFRAMIYHNPIVKVGDVHKYLQGLLKEGTQDLIKNLLRFGKRMGRHDTKGKKGFIKKYLKDILKAGRHPITYLKERKSVQKVFNFFTDRKFLKGKMKPAMVDNKKAEGSKTTIGKRQN